MKKEIDIKIEYIKYINLDQTIKQKKRYILKINNNEIDECIIYKNNIILNFMEGFLNILNIEYGNFESYQKAFKKFGIEV